MPSPFRKLQMAVRAQMASGITGAPVAAGHAPAFPSEGPAATEYQGLLAALHNDLRTLHEIQSVERKIEAKRGMMGAYTDWVAGALETEGGQHAPQDEIVVTMLVWALDCQEWEFALDIAQHCLFHGLSLPERYKRTMACLVVEEIADAAKVDPASVPEDVLHQATMIAAEYDMPDQVKAKAWRARGLALMAKAEAFDPASESAGAGGKPMLVDAALEALTRATALDSKVGVKKQIEQLRAESKRMAAEAQAKADAAAKSEQRSSA